MPVGAPMDFLSSFASLVRGLKCGSLRMEEICMETTSINSRFQILKIVFLISMKDFFLLCTFYKAAGFDYLTSFITGFKILVIYIKCLLTQSHPWFKTISLSSSKLLWEDPLKFLNLRRGLASSYYPCWTLHSQWNYRGSLWRDSISAKSLQDRFLSGSGRSKLNVQEKCKTLKIS